LIDTATLAARIHIPLATLTAWRAAGRVPAVKWGQRWLHIETEIATWIAAGLAVSLTG
jgi:hypothetical protein